MSEEVIPSESELYNNIVEMLSNGNFLQLNGKAINLAELNEYINAQGREIERLNNIINELEEYIKPFLYMLNGITDKDEYEQAQLDTFTDIMEKLQELKGSDKE